MSSKRTFSFQWHITDDCDQRCQHCYIFQIESRDRLVRMTWGQMQETLANMEEFCARFGREPYLYITGGDPLLHPDFWRLMELLEEKGYRSTVMGNPFHLTPEVCTRMKACGVVRYQLSIDGMRETHDWFRMPGSFDATLAAIPMLRRAGLRAVIMTTVSGVNIDEVPDIVDLVVEHGANVFAFGRYVPGAGKSNGIEPYRYRALLDVCHHKFKRYEDAGCDTYFNRKDHLWTLYEYEEGLWRIPDGAEEGKVYGGCNCGSGHFTVTSRGEVLACRRVVGSNVGDVYKDRLSDLWCGKMEDYRNFGGFEKCSRCELLAWCRGCPAVASGTNGSFYAPDPQCWKDV
ncbi:MAG: radical SAM/SPASM domain protein, ACGX system [Acidobacteriota bacterium]|nr:radical SAM/SPASM domain protein, ACGX system [Acidobacteriota bacterium]